MANEEFTRREQMIVESRDPFRQARIFFFYPATIAGASVASWVSLTRLIAGLGGFRTDTVPLTDGINLCVNVGIVAAAVYFGRGDLKAKTEALKEESARRSRKTEEDEDEQD